ncbi:MAG TPA: nuclear transport factor 2 family protein [Solirubrobacterales bacterium]|nr:nuclear transport factor 2 family protein [Solirubrobacterales bacterium]
MPPADTDVSGAATRRPLEDAFFVRFPGLYGVALRSIIRLRPGSPLRRRLLLRALRRNYAASDRRDVEYVLLGIDPDCEMRHIGAPVGIAERYPGHEGVRNFLSNVFDTWVSSDWRLIRVHDGGDRVVVESEMRGRGRGSGVAVSLTYGAVFRPGASGRMVRLEYYWEGGWPAALAAAGLSNPSPSGAPSS